MEVANNCGVPPVPLHYVRCCKVDGEQRRQVLYLCGGYIYLGVKVGISMHTNFFL